MNSEKEFLTKEEREAMIRTHKTLGNKRHADRIKAILLFDDGYSKIEISRILLIDRGSINIRLFQYKKFGLVKLFLRIITKDIRDD